MVTFKKIDPHPQLRPYVSTYWHLSSAGADLPPCCNRVLPDGFTDIIINLGDPFIQANDPAFIAGIMRRPLVVGLKGRLDLLGISFRPGMAGIFLDLPISELADRRVGLGEVWNCRKFEDGLRECDGPAERIAWLDSYLLGLRVGETDRAVAWSVDQIYRREGQLAMPELAHCANLSNRQLERRFQREVGLSPKELARLVRFRRALRLLPDQDSRLSSIAYDCGYSDQAHFTREFKAYTGLTPGSCLHKEISSVVFFQD